MMAPALSPKAAVTAAFYVSNKLHHHPPQPQICQKNSHSSLGYFRLSSSSSPFSETSEKEKWFEAGREAAKRLNSELVTTSQRQQKDTTKKSTEYLSPINKGEQSSNHFEVSEEDEEVIATLYPTVWNTGRSCARKLLKEMTQQTNLVEGCDESPSFMVTDASVKTNALESVETNTDDEFHDCGSIDNSIFKKSHCVTICMVPPAISAVKAWSQLTTVRRECRDPGFYRWPPHVNLLYPFLQPYANITLTEQIVLDRMSSDKEIRLECMKKISQCLEWAAEECRPFDVYLNSFGCFGGRNRGVLWAAPEARYSENVNTIGDYSDDEDPLVHLQNMLEKQFPMCREQKKQGSFTPHMTISHYANLSDALRAKEEVESKWEPVSFHVSEVYLLERVGDDGQFQIAATIPLGPNSIVQIHDPHIPFPDMPLIEEEWVHIERMKLKSRRNKKRSNR